MCKKKKKEKQEVRKMTKVEMYEMLLNMEEVNANDELVAKIQTELDVLSRKSSNESAKRKEKKEHDEVLRGVILSVLQEAGEPLSRTGIQERAEELASLSPQKITSLMSPLVKEGVVKKSLTMIEKKKSTVYSV
jgi:hypothetical protein